MSFSIRYDIPMPEAVRRIAFRETRKPRTELSQAMDEMDVGGCIDLTNYHEYIDARNRVHLFRPKRFSFRRKGVSTWQLWRYE